jgi:GxxExxY protein
LEVFSFKPASQLPLPDKDFLRLECNGIRTPVLALKQTGLRFVHNKLVFHRILDLKRAGISILASVFKVLLIDNVPLPTFASRKTFPMLHEQITEGIIGCAMKVHTRIGNGFQELIYQRAFALELAAANLGFAREVDMEIHYKGTAIGTRRVDFFVEGLIMVELKAVSRLENIHTAQAINYLEGYQLQIGLLINFGAPRLEFRRVFNNKAL